jgi:two-component system sensor histidine kinase HydH
MTPATATIQADPARDGPRRASAADRLTRWLPVAFALGLGLVLLVTVVYVRGALADAAELATHGQADALVRVVRATARRARGELNVADLEAILEDHGEDGLRYVALRARRVGRMGRVDPTGRAEQTGPAGEALSAGTALGESWALGVSRVGDRVRAVLGARRPGPRGRPRMRAPIQLVALEFEPVLAARMQTQATVVLWVGGAAALSLVLFALLLAGMLRQRERLRREQEAQRRLAALGEMSAVLAHEIRNPLASLKGHGQLLVELLGLEGSRHEERAAQVVSDAVRLQALTTDLLAFVRSGALQRAPTDPAELLRAAAADVGDEAVTVRTEGAPASWSLDAERMRQALVNVLENAAHASPQGRPPVATLGASKGALVITVRDFGPGIAPGSEARIFEPFQTDKTQGTGLGLAITRRIVEQHGGRIVATNHPEGGALFTLTIAQDR